MTASSAGQRDVDARFLLANERTLLAWVRTALTLLAVGVGVLQFGTDVGARRLIAIFLVFLAAFAGALGTARYWRADRAIHEGRLPKSGWSPTVVSGAVVAVALIALVAAIFDIGG